MGKCKDCNCELFSGDLCIECEENYKTPEVTLKDIKEGWINLKKDNSEFIKYDNSKNMLSLIEPKFIEGLGQVLTYGANKYAKDNWKKCNDLDRYHDALLRHLYAYLGGEENDSESGLSHLDHISANVMFIRYFKDNK